MDRLKIWSCIAAMFAVPSSAFAEMWISGLVGANATQATFTTSKANYVSFGYAGYVLGGGVTLSPTPTTAVEADALLSQRKFGFYDVKNSFTSLQIPVFANYRIMNFYAGAGGYASLWRFDGETVQGSKTSKSSPQKSGFETLEIGFGLDVGSNFSFYGFPLRFDFRRLQSIKDMATSTSIKGKIVEYQVALGYALGAKIK